MFNPIDWRVMLKESRFSKDQVVRDGCNHSIQHRCLSISSYHKVVGFNGAASDFRGN
jgi:hypothetical protein